MNDFVEQKMLTFQHLKRYAAIFCFAGVFSMPSLAGVHVDVNIGVGSPGYYGVLPIQGVTPSLWNANPIVAIGAALAGAPVYLTVPDKHRRHWKRYCAEYGACGVPVYFVRRGWYNSHYGHAAPPPPRHYGAPRHFKDHGWKHRPPGRDWDGHKHGHKKHHHKD